MDLTLTPDFAPTFSTSAPDEVVAKIIDLGHSILGVFTKEQKSVTRQNKLDIKTFTQAIINAALVLKNNYPTTSEPPIDTNETLKRIQQDIAELKLATACKCAAATSLPPSSPLPIPSHAPNVTYACVVKATDGTLTPTTVKQTLRREINPRQLKCGIDRIEPIRDGVRIVCPTERDRDTIAAAINDTDHLQSSVPVRRKPLLILKGLSRDTTPADLPAILIAQNPLVCQAVGDRLVEDAIRVRHIKRNRKPTLQNVILEVTGGVHRAALSQEQLYVDLQRVRVMDFVPLIQCYQCLGFGHTSKICTRPKPVCSHCGGDHTFRACPVAAELVPKCVNCAKTQSPSAHNGMSPACPIIIRMIQRVREKTDYYADV